MNDISRVGIGAVTGLAHVPGIGGGVVHEDVIRQADIAAFTPDRAAKSSRMVIGESSVGDAE